MLICKNCKKKNNNPIVKEQKSHSTMYCQYCGTKFHDIHSKDFEDKKNFLIDLYNKRTSDLISRGVKRVK